MASLTFCIGFAIILTPRLGGATPWQARPSMQASAASPSAPLAFRRPMVAPTLGKASPWKSGPLPMVHPILNAPLGEVIPRRPLETPKAYENEWDPKKNFMAMKETKGDQPYARTKGNQAIARRQPQQKGHTMQGRKIHGRRKRIGFKGNPKARAFERERLRRLAESRAAKAKHAAWMASREGKTEEELKAMDDAEAERIRIAHIARNFYKRGNINRMEGFRHPPHTARGMDERMGLGPRPKGLPHLERKKNAYYKALFKKEGLKPEPGRHPWKAFAQKRIQNSRVLAGLGPNERSKINPFDKAGPRDPDWTPPTPRERKENFMAQAGFVPEVLSAVDADPSELASNGITLAGCAMAAAVLSAAGFAALQARRRKELPCQPEPALG